MSRHRKWIRTLGATVVLLGMGAALDDIVLQAVLDLKKQPLDEDLVQKVYSLLVDPPRDARIVIAGDSRAERQVIPEIFRAELGVDAVNVAVPAGELASTSKVLRRYGILEKKPVLVISVTSFQINDGATDHDAISMDTLIAMQWIDQVSIFRKNLPEMAYRKIRMYMRCLRAEAGRRPVKKKQYAEDGFTGIDRVLDTSQKLAGAAMTEPDRTSHPWYKDLSLHGRKWRVFQAALREIAQSGCPVLLFSGPSSPAWRQVSDNTFIDAAEREYARMLEQEAARYPNVHFLDFHGGWVDDFPNAMFYDIQHLNRAGAARFSSILCSEIERLNLLVDP